MKGNTKLRQNSIKDVLLEIKRNGPISKRELQNVTDFSWGKISLITNFLVDNGYVAPSGKQETIVGRKPEELDININDNYVIGVDFNYMQVVVVVCDFKGRVVNRYQSAFINPDYDIAINTIYNLVQRAIYDHPSKKIHYIAAALQGAVNLETGVSLGLSAIKGWKNVPVKALLEDRFKIPTVVFYDTASFLYSDMLYGNLKNETHQNVAHIGIDRHGVGISALVSGEVYIGANGKKCEIGDVMVPDGNGGMIRFYGILCESYIEKNYEKMTGDKLKCEEIVTLCRNGDEDAELIFENVGKALGYALISVMSLINSEKIVFFGALTYFLDLLLPHTEKLITYLWWGYCPKFEIAKLSPDAAAVGAALYASDIFIENLEFSESED